MYEAAHVRVRELTLRQFLIGLAKLLTPLLLAALYVLYLLTLGEAGRTLLPLLAAYFFPPLGKESVIPLGISLGVQPAIMALSVALVDVLVGLFLLWNYRLLYYVPLLGKWVAKLEKKAQRMVEEGRGFSKLAWVGLVLFVIVPFQGSGAVAATVLGKMSGMDAKKVWAAVCTGAFAGTFMVAYSFHLLLDAFQADLLLGAVVVVTFVAVLILLYVRWKQTTGERLLTLGDIKEVSLLAPNAAVATNGGAPAVTAREPPSEGGPFTTQDP